MILIIGILASIAVPVFLNQRKKSQEASLVSDLKNLGIAMETELVSNKGSYSGSIPADFVASSGNMFSMSPESGNTNVAAGSDGTYPGRVGQYSNQPGLYPKNTKIDGYNSLDYSNFTTQVTGGPYWDYIPKNASGIQPGEKFAGSVNVRSSADVCMILRIELHRTDPGWQHLNSPQYCLKAGEWQELEVSGETPYLTTSLTLIAYSIHQPKTIFDYKEPIIVLGSTINKGNIKIASNQRYCIEGYNENNPSNIFHYSTLNGGVEEGRC